MRQYTDRKIVIILSFCFLLVISTAAVLAPWITQYSFDAQDIEAQLRSPSASHLMGTDSLGRDLFCRVLYGARISLAVGLMTAVVSTALGVVCGAVAGFVGGWVDAILMRVVDMFYIFPSLLLAILITVVMGQGLLGIVLSLSAFSWVNVARLVRSQILRIREYPHVEAARALGVRPLRIIVKHVLPLLWGQTLVAVTLQIPNYIASESFLSFLGLGVQPPFSSWGSLAAEGWRAMQSYPHLILFPGGFLFLTLVSIQFLGDGLRDWIG